MSYQYTYSCRLDADDKSRFYDGAKRFDLSPSEYLRYLIRLPNEFHDGEADGPVVVLDRKSVSGIRREIVRWGHHYNQAVHALNTLALATRKRGELDIEYFTVTLDKVSEELDIVEVGRQDVTAALTELVSLPKVGD